LLQQQTEVKLLVWLNKKEGITVFLTTHYMEEADKIANRIAVIDHGKIISIGSSAELKEKTGKQSLEDAFLALTGNAIRVISRTVNVSERVDEVPDAIFLIFLESETPQKSSGNQSESQQGE
jgi:ABC-type multidrug transport system ATPase subunit